MAFDATKQYQGSIDANDRGVAEMLNSAYLQTGTTNPDASNAANEGVLYLNTSTGELFRDNGGAWVSVGKVSTSTVQTFTGVKTFGSKPKLPATEPQGNEAVSRSRADTLIANAIQTERSARMTEVATLRARVQTLEDTADRLYYSPDAAAILQQFNYGGLPSTGVSFGRMLNVAALQLAYTGTVRVTLSSSSSSSSSNARLIFVVRNDAPNSSGIYPTVDVPSDPAQLLFNPPTTSPLTINVNIGTPNSWLAVYVAGATDTTALSSSRLTGLTFEVGARLVGGS